MQASVTKYISLIRFEPALWFISEGSGLDPQAADIIDGGSQHSLNMRSYGTRCAFYIDELVVAAPASILAAVARVIDSPRGGSITAQYCR